jgi:phosphatidylglycerophosphate synthase
MKVRPAAIVAVQDRRMVVDWYFLLKASPYFAAPLIGMGFSANATTVLWGIINLGGAALVYLAIAGHVWLVPAILFTFLVSEILDTTDGEIARYTGTSSPIGGKLVDGVCHKVTEFALATAFVCGAATLTGSPFVLPIGLALLSGEGMLGYTYERRLLIIRVHMQSREKAGGGRPVGGTYEAGTAWLDLPRGHKVRSITGLVSYKSVYVAILIAAVSPLAFLWALAALAAYKHMAWIRLAVRTVVTTPRTMAAPAPSEAATGGLTAEGRR